MPLPDVPHPRVPAQRVRKSYPYASRARRLLMEDVKSKAPDLEEALDDLNIMSMRFGKRKSRGIEQILSFVEASILMQVLHFSEEDLKDLEKELVRYNKRLQDYFEQHDDKRTYKDLVSEFKEEQAHCRTLQDTSDGGSMIAWVLNKGEDQGYTTPWEHNVASSHAAIPSSSSHSLEHRLTSRQKKVYYDC